MNTEPSNPPSCMRTAKHRVLFLVAAVTVCGSLLVTYGSEKHYLGALAFSLAISGALLLRSRKLGVSLSIVTALGAALWPVDAYFYFPVLRTLQARVPYGPTISVFPSPSGKSTAYVYDYGFLDSSYVLRVSRGWRFPGQSTYIESERDSFTASAKWEGERLIVSNDTGTFTLVYSERTGEIEITRKKGEG
jgi:hypothetical protein